MSDWNYSKSNRVPYAYHRMLAWKDYPDDLFMQNCLAFHRIVQLYEKNISFYFPNKTKAPWQLQANIGGENVNFWPHKMKAHVEYSATPSVEGYYEVINLINEQFAKEPERREGGDDNWTIDDDFDVFE